MLVFFSQMFVFFKKRLMLTAAITVAFIFAVSLYNEWLLFAFSVFAAFVAAVFIYEKAKGEYIFTAVLILAVILSGYFTNLKSQSFEKLDGVSCTGEFTVCENPENMGNYYLYTLETVESDILPKGAKIYVNGNCYFEFSQKIRAEITLKRFYSSQSRNSFFGNGIYMGGHIKTYRKTGENDFVLSIIAFLRNYIKTKVFENYKTERAATMMAVTAGDKSFLSGDFYQNAKRAGVAHVLVVSGMHLSIIVSLFLYLTQKFFYNRFLKALIIFFVTFSVMAVCGFTMSILRAGITYLLIALSLVLNRVNTSENTLGFAVLIILLLKPFAILNIAFLLSVLSTFAILVVAIPVINFLANRIGKKHIFTISALSIAVVSLSALIFTAPVVIYYFGYISVVSVITNLLITTAVSAAMCTCVLGFLLPFCETVLFKISEVYIFYVNSVINYFGSLKFAALKVPKYFSIIFIIIIIAILFCLLACKVKRDMVKSKQIQFKLIAEGGCEENAAMFGTDFEKRNKKRKKKYIHIIRK